MRGDVYIDLHVTLLKIAIFPNSKLSLYFNSYRITEIKAIKT